MAWNLSPGSFRVLSGQGGVGGGEREDYGLGCENMYSLITQSQRIPFIISLTVCQIRETMTNFMHLLSGLNETCVIASSSFCLEAAFPIT